MDIEELIRNVPDFPKAGIQFKDITTLLQNPPAFCSIIDGWKEKFQDKGVDAIIGAEARGFIFGAALAYAMEVPFIPVRKRGKLPAKTLSQEFELEYGKDEIEIHIDAIKQGDRVLLVDDLLATGGTMEAMTRLVEDLGGEIVEILFVVELPLLKGRERLGKYAVSSLVEFSVE